MIKSFYNWWYELVGVAGIESAKEVPDFLYYGFFVAAIIGFLIFIIKCLYFEVEESFDYVTGLFSCIGGSIGVFYLICLGFPIFVTVFAFYLIIAGFGKSIDYLSKKLKIKKVKKSS